MWREPTGPGTKVTPSALREDLLEEAVARLPALVDVSTLQRVLHALGRSECLADMPPLVAAVTFRDAVLAHVRAKHGGLDHVRALLDSARPELREHAFDTAFFVFGLRRGGNHAFANWLRGMLPKHKTLYLNSAEIGLYRVAEATLTVDSFSYSGVPIGRRRHLIVGYENVDPHLFPFEHNARVAKRAHAVLVLRDLPNQAASIVQQARQDPAFGYRYRVRELLALWPQLARFALRGAPGFTFVPFPTWIRDRGMRRKLARDLGLEFEDKGRFTVSAHGAGSSFDGTSLDGAADRMDVLRRWPAFVDSELFQFLLLANSDALALNSALFGEDGPDASELFASIRRRS